MRRIVLTVLVGRMALFRPFVVDGIDVPARRMVLTVLVLRMIWTCLGKVVTCLNGFV